VPQQTKIESTILQSANPITLSLSMVGKNLHDHHLELWHAMVIISMSWSSLFSWDQMRSQYAPMYSIYIKDLIGDLSKSTSFLLSHIAQQNTDVSTSNCHFSFPPIWFVHVTNKCCIFYGGEMLKVIWTSPQRNLTYKQSKKQPLYRLFP
jgi:hypothetical protein